MLKKTTLAVLMAVSGLASAGMYSTPPAPSCTPGDVTVPCAASFWDIGIQALYLQPVYGQIYGLSQSGTYKPFDPDWGWGYRLEGSYHFNTGNDITMNWTHYDVDSILTNYRDVFFLAATTPRYVTANTRFDITNKFDQVNLTFGQHVDMGLLKNAHFYAGLQYANIRVDGQSLFDIPSPAILAATNGVRIQRNYDLSAVGPVFGVDYSYNITPALSVVADGYGSLVYGTSRVDYATIYNVGLVAADTYASKKALITGFGAKLGANFAYPMAHGILNVQGGYQVIDYLQPLHSIRLDFTSDRHIVGNDFGLYGPYVGLKWLGNA